MLNGSRFPVGKNVKVLEKMIRLKRKHITSFLMLDQNVMRFQQRMKWKINTKVFQMHKQG